MDRFIKGRCWACNKAFQWLYHKGRELYNTTCPFCGGTLHQTAHYMRSCQWYEIIPGRQPRPIKFGEIRDCTGESYNTKQGEKI